MGYRDASDGWKFLAPDRELRVRALPFDGRAFFHRAGQRAAANPLATKPGRLAVRRSKVRDVLHI
jgi:hypothetical protein